MPVLCLRRHPGLQTFFNRIDQLGNISRLGHNAVARECAGLCLSFRDYRREKNDRRFLQSRIGIDLCRYIASVALPAARTVYHCWA